MTDYSKIIEEISFNGQGLVPAIAQDYKTGEVLMMAWMNEDSIIETLSKKQICYFSRSRNKLWRKGESSGQIQKLKEFIIDCDGDTILLKVEQNGVACHTGRRNCFYKTVKNDEIIVNQDVMIDPDNLYK